MKQRVGGKFSVLGLSHDFKFYLWVNFIYLKGYEFNANYNLLSNLC